MKASFAFGLLAILSSTNVQAKINDLELTQVLIVSRHGLRAPLTEGSEMLIKATPYKWPHWDTDAGLLTTKGGALEVFMGGYVKSWLVATGLVEKNSCANDTLFVYTNTMPRTIATGQFFMDGAFPGCRVEIQTQADNKNPDPLFYQSIKKPSESFVTENKKSILNFIKGKDLDASFNKLEEVVNYKQSFDCREKKSCNLSREDNIINLDPSKEPSIDGPLHKGFLMVDAFILQNYEGFPAKDVAWGHIKNDAEWKLLSRLRNTYIEAAYLQPNIAKNLTPPLIQKVGELLPERMGENDKKIYTLVGHDTTVGPLLVAMGVNRYELPGQFEHTPIGGKVVFQRWTDKKIGKDYLKTEYIYQTTEQMRELMPLSMATPPMRVTLSFKDCPVDSHGYCEWKNLRKVLSSVQD